MSSCFPTYCEGASRLATAFLIRPRLVEQQLAIFLGLVLPQLFPDFIRFL
jgi:hypothetical protein